MTKKLLWQETERKAKQQDQRKDLSTHNQLLSTPSKATPGLGTSPKTEKTTPFPDEKSESLDPFKSLARQEKLDPGVRPNQRLVNRVD